VNNVNLSQKLDAVQELLGGDLLMIEESHGKNTLKLALAEAYLRNLLHRAGVVKHLSQRHPDMPGEFQKLPDAPALKSNAQCGSRYAERPIMSDRPTTSNNRYTHGVVQTACIADIAYPWAR